MGGPVVAPITSNPVAVPGPIQGPASTPTPAAQTPNLGYDPKETPNSFTALYDDPSKNPKQAGLAVGKSAAAIAKDIETQSNANFADPIKVTKKTESTGILGLGTGKHVLELETPSGQSKVFKWSKDEKEPSAQINEWLDEQKIPSGQRNFEIATVKAEEVKPLISALNGADNIHIKEIPADSGKVEIDRARFAYGKQDGNFVVKRDGTNILANLGKSQDGLSIQGSNANDTLVSEWTGAPTTLDGGTGNDILGAIGNGKSKFTIKDDSGENWLTALNTGSGSKLATGKLSRSNKFDVSGGEVEIDSKGNSDLIRLGEGDHEVAVAGARANIVETASATKHYSIDDIDVDNKSSVVGIAKEEIVNVDGEQKIAYPNAPDLYRGSGGGIFGGSPSPLYNGTDGSITAIEQSADDAYKKQMGLFIGGAVLLSLLAVYSSQNSDDDDGWDSGYGGGFDGGFGSKYAYLHEGRGSRYA